MRDGFRGIVRGRTTADQRLRVADKALVGVEDGAHACRVDQETRRKRIVRIGIDRRNSLGLLRAGIAGPFQLRNAEKALVEQRGLVLVQSVDGASVWRTWGLGAGRDPWL